MKTTEKLNEIIRKRGVDIQRLSKSSQIASDRLESIVNGTEPTLSELRKLSGALHINIMDLVAIDEPRRASQWLFRQVGSANPDVDPAALANLSGKIECSLNLIQTPTEDALWWSKYFIRDISFSAAEENASVFRRLFYNDDQVSPLLSLPKLLIDKLGILVFVVDAKGLDGASVYFERTPYIFVSNRFRPRMLFTLAHELGHILSHHDPAESFAVYDEERISEGEDVGVPGEGNEKYAHAFASCLLLPGVGVGVALQKIRSIHKIDENANVGDIEILLLSRIFGVSFVAAARRLEDLTLLPRGGAKALDDWLKQHFKSAEQRAESLRLPDRPSIEFPRIPERLLSSAINQIRSGKISLGKASAVLGIPISDILIANKPQQ